MGHWFFFAAGGLAALWGAVHVVAGGRDILVPALGPSGLPPVVRDTLYVCWHFTTAAIALMALLFVWSGLSSDLTGAWFGTALALAFAAIGIGLVRRQRGRYRDLPQGWLFVPVALLGGLGLAV